MILVVAGSYVEALNYAVSHELHASGWRYCASERIAAGMDRNTTRVVFVGTWERRADHVELHALGRRFRSGELET